MAELFQEILTLHGLFSILTLTVMEIVLGIDNIIFISILAGKLPRSQQQKARSIGLGMAFIFRASLLTAISWIVGLTTPLFTIFSFGLSGRDIILLVGGVFLLTNTLTEIISKLKGEDEEQEFNPKALSLTSAVIQIILLDIIFSFDSILTAVGLVKNPVIMIIAVLFSLMIMLRFSRIIGDYVNSHPTIRMLALAFLVMIGILLVIESFHMEIPKSYVYVAMVFSLIVEYLNMRVRQLELEAKQREEKKELIEKLHDEVEE
jgi:predicted tellurium resistance membrane protein TerC